MEYIPRRNWRYPMQHERFYNKVLQEYVDNIFIVYYRNSAVVGNLIKNHGVKLDSDDPVQDVIDMLKSEAPKPEDLLPKVQAIFNLVNDFNKKEFNDILRSIRVQALVGERWYNTYRDQWIADNMALIKSISDETMRQVEMHIRDTIATTVEDGVRSKYLANKIRDLTGVTQRRAALIARDQVGKLNGRITEYRQRELGIKKYKWRTSHDSRVRPLHAERDGEIFRWDKPPSDGHPGMPIRCRCVALPIIDFDHLDKLGHGVPRANRAAVQEAMKRYGFKHGEGSVYARVVGAEPLVNSDNGLYNYNIGKVEQAKKRNKKVFITDQAIEKVPKLEIPNFSDEICRKIQEEIKNVLRIAKTENNSDEVLSVSTADFSQKVIVKGTQDKVSIGSTYEGFSLWLRAKEHELMFIHNHPSTNTFSLVDIRSLLSDDKLRMMVVITNLGKAYILVKGPKYDYDKARALYLEAYSLVNSGKIDSRQAVMWLLKRVKEMGVYYVR